jgi:hypothetical protein
MRYEFSAKCSACKSAPGNAAAMRDALEEARKFLLTNKDGYFESRLVPQIDAALAAPARNCDRFENWMQAWDGYLAKYPDARHGTPFEIGRFHTWLFATAKFGRPWTAAEDELATWLFAEDTSFRDAAVKQANKLADELRNLLD